MTTPARMTSEELDTLESQECHDHACAVCRNKNRRLFAHIAAVTREGAAMTKRAVELELENRRWQREAMAARQLLFAKGESTGREVQEYQQARAANSDTHTPKENTCS